MYYENPQTPHEVNVSNTSEIGSFFKMTAIIVVILSVLFAVIYLSARFFAAFIPYSVEVSLAQNFVILGQDAENTYEEAADELQSLALKLAKNMNAPHDMPLNVSIIKDSEKNAFATLGGYIFVTDGFLKSVESENALSMVLAHEIAHIKNRDPITAVAGSAAFSLITAVVFGADAGFYEDSISIVSSSFSRTQEERADKDALLALKNYYGHTFGAEEFFQKVLKDERFSVKFLSSHPDTQKRIEYILKTQENSIKAEPKPLSKAVSAMQQMRK
jgi:Zn-dependent protease with chaperone function